MSAIDRALEWEITQDPVGYPEAVARMEARTAAIRAGEASELIWLLEHPPLYTAGTSAQAEDLLESRFPVYATGRGGQFTYHGPGQRVAYVMLDLQRRMAPEPDLRRFIGLLEEWIIRTLAAFGVKGERRHGRVGIWVASPVSRDLSLKEREIVSQENKIAAIGIRVKKWVSLHGLAINLHPDLSHYAGIVPCGIRDHGVTSLRALGKGAVSMAEVDAALRREFGKLEWRGGERDDYR